MKLEIEQHIKLELMLNEVKLEGFKNYLSWSCRASLILKTKGLERLVIGERVEPADESIIERGIWSSTNSLGVAWLINLTSPLIVSMIKDMPVRCESNEKHVLLCWKCHAHDTSRKETYEYKGGATYCHGICRELIRLCLGCDYYDPLIVPDAGMVAINRKWIDRQE